nr:hypothetical protein [Tanacetum cinerariifolium]
MKVVVLASVECGGVGGGIGGGINGAVVVVVVPAVVVARDSGGEKANRETRNLFGFAGKIPPQKFSGGGSVVAAVAAAVGLGWLDFWWGE